jgi:uncharacterized protein (DUF427 family)
MAQGVGHKFKPQHCKQINKNKNHAFETGTGGSHLATQEAEVRKMEASPREIVRETLSRKYSTHTHTHTHTHTKGLTKWLKHLPSKPKKKKKNAAWGAHLA